MSRVQIFIISFVFLFWFTPDLVGPRATFSGIASPAIAGERFQPRDCEFSVEFPGKPEIYDIIIPSIGKVQNAKYTSGSGSPSDSYVFMAEGFPVSLQEVFRYHKDVEAYLLESAQSYAEANGIQQPEFRLFKDTLGNGIGMRGYKTISGIPTIFSSISFLGERSIIHLRAMCAAELFPPPGMTRFMNSVQRVTIGADSEWAYTSISYNEWGSFNPTEKRMIIGSYLAGYHQWLDNYVAKEAPIISKKKYKKLIQKYTELAFCVGRKGGAVDNLINLIDKRFKKIKARKNSVEWLAFEILDSIYKKCKEINYPGDPNK